MHPTHPSSTCSTTWSRRHPAARSASHSAAVALGIALAAGGGLLSGGAGCGSGVEMAVAWTVDGQPAARGCAAVERPRLELVVRDQHQADAGAVRFAVPCADGSATLVVPERAEVRAELFDGDVLLGEAGPAERSIPVRIPVDARASPERPIELAVEFERGRLSARLTAAGQSCDAARIEEFRVTLRRVAGPLEAPIVDDAEGVRIACEGGEARFSYAPVHIGSRYELVATAEADDGRWTTNAFGRGAGVMIRGARTDVAVDLRPAARP